MEYLERRRSRVEDRLEEVLAGVEPTDLADQLRHVSLSGVIAELCDRVLVMYGGEIMEAGTTEQILTAPRHPYTRALLTCMPQTTPRKQRLNVIDGQVPDLLGEIQGCPFASRCTHAAEECRAGAMPTVDVGDDHHAKCCRLDDVERESAREPEPVRPTEDR